jgi:hypothetical protein
MWQIITPEYAMSLESQPLNPASPLPTEFAKEMSKLSIWGQMKLLLQYVEAKKGHIRGLAAGLKVAEGRLDEQVAQLRQKKKDLEECYTVYHETMKGFGEKKSELEQLKLDCDELESRPGVKETLRHSQVSLARRRGTKHVSLSSSGPGNKPAAVKRPALQSSEDDFSDDESLKIRQRFAAAPTGTCVEMDQNTGRDAGTTELDATNKTAASPEATD